MKLHALAVLRVLASCALAISVGSMSTGCGSGTVSNQTGHEFRVIDEAGGLLSDISSDFHQANAVYRTPDRKWEVVVSEPWFQRQTEVQVVATIENPKLADDQTPHLDARRRRPLPARDVSTTKVEQTNHYAVLPLLIRNITDEHQQFVDHFSNGIARGMKPLRWDALMLAQIDDSRWSVAGDLITVTHHLHSTRCPDEIRAHDVWWLYRRMIAPGTEREVLVCWGPIDEIPDGYDFFGLAHASKWGSSRPDGATWFLVPHSR